VRTVAQGGAVATPVREEEEEEAQGLARERLVAGDATNMSRAAAEAASMTESAPAGGVGEDEEAAAAGVSTWRSREVGEEGEEVESEEVGLSFDAEGTDALGRGDLSLSLLSGADRDTPEPGPGRAGGLTALSRGSDLEGRERRGGGERVEEAEARVACDVIYVGDDVEAGVAASLSSSSSSSSSSSALVPYPIKTASILTNSRRRDTGSARGRGLSEAAAAAHGGGGARGASAGEKSACTASGGGGGGGGGGEGGGRGLGLEARVQQAGLGLGERARKRLRLPPRSWRPQEHHHALIRLQLEGTWEPLSSSLAAGVGGLAGQGGRRRQAAASGGREASLILSCVAVRLVRTESGAGGREGGSAGGMAADGAGKGGDASPDSRESEATKQGVYADLARQRLLADWWVVGGGWCVVE